MGRLHPATLLLRQPGNSGDVATPASMKQRNMTSTFDEELHIPLQRSLMFTGGIRRRSTDAILPTSCLSHVLLSSSPGLRPHQLHALVPNSEAKGSNSMQAGSIRTSRAVHALSTTVLGTVQHGKLFGRSHICHQPEHAASRHITRREVSWLIHADDP